MPEATPFVLNLVPDDEQENIINQANMDLDTITEDQGFEESEGDNITNQICQLQRELRRFMQRTQVQFNALRREQQEMKAEQQKMAAELWPIKQLLEQWEKRMNGVEKICDPYGNVQFLR